MLNEICNMYVFITYLLSQYVGAFYLYGGCVCLGLIQRGLVEI
jgi:hypothetical protein